jgi:hypothetical protein
MWWCCCSRRCQLPATDLRVDGWYFVAPPIPPERHDMPSIDLIFHEDFFGPGDHAWRSGCLPRDERPINGWSELATYFAFDLAKTSGSRTIADPDGCCYWTMDGFSASSCDCADHVVAAATHEGTAPGAGGNAFRSCSNGGGGWSLVSRVESPFEETWVNGSSYIKIYAP